MASVLSPSLSALLCDNTDNDAPESTRARRTFPSVVRRATKGKCEVFAGAFSKEALNKVSV